jgi:serine-type D-Ala-D-Ala carboxypeptidase (penicillin-binding protein 5/6)
VARARLQARVTGIVAGLALAACAVVATAPAASAASGPGYVSAASAAVENAGTGQLLWSRDLNAERPIGSITKVMTALVVIEAGNLNRKITVPSSVLSYMDTYGGSSAGLVAGDKLTALQLLYALMLPSGCDAAYTLAKAYGPGLTAFVAKMNATAKKLGLKGTHFANFDGLPWPGEYSTYSTAGSLLKLGRAAMASPVFRAIAGKRTYKVAAGSGHHGYVWHNLDPLLGVYRGATGIKTGYTLAAGECLLFAATRNGHSLIGVALDSTGTGMTVNGADATRILNWAFQRVE